MERGMVTREDIESFLIRMDLSYTEVADGMYLLRSGEAELPTVVHVTPPLVVIRLKLLDLPARNGMEDLYRTLLELNAVDVVHGAYGIEDGELILTDTLQLETLDFVELQASLESLQIAASSHMERITTLAGAGVEG
jgi:hypothetical protein